MTDPIYRTKSVPLEMVLILFLRSEIRERRGVTQNSGHTLIEERNYTILSLMVI